MGRGRKARNPRGKGYGLRSYDVPPASDVLVYDAEGQVVRTEEAVPVVGKWDTAAKKAQRELRKSRERIDATKRGTPSGSWRSTRGKGLGAVVRTMTAQLDSKCPQCREPIARGEKIYLLRESELWVCAPCRKAVAKK